VIIASPPAQQDHQADRLGFTEEARFDEYGAEQWFGVRS
jgi:hypothetical protein